MHIAFILISTHIAIRNARLYTGYSAGAQRSCTRMHAHVLIDKVMSDKSDRGSQSFGPSQTREADGAREIFRGRSSTPSERADARSRPLGPISTLAQTRRTDKRLHALHAPHAVCVRSLDRLATPPRQSSCPASLSWFKVIVGLAGFDE